MKLMLARDHLKQHYRTSRICCLNEQFCGLKCLLSATTRRATIPIKPTSMPAVHVACEV